MQERQVYTAGPLGFSEVGRDFHDGRMVPMLEKLGFGVLDPWKLTDASVLEPALTADTLDEKRRQWREVNPTIGRNNEQAIEESDVVVAVLDGVDVDSGTAAEIGFAYGRGKLIIGYRGDFRLSADNYGSQVNLQVEHFIRASGGVIVDSLEDLENVLTTVKNSLDGKRERPTVAVVDHPQEDNGDS